MANFWRDREADAISTYWNAVTDGQLGPDRAATEIDSTLVDTIARIREGRQRHIPSSAFVDRLEIALMNTQVRSIAARPPLLKELVTRPAWLPTREMLFPRKWSLAAVASVALVAITFAVFFFSFRQTDHPVIAPGTPEVATPTTAPIPAPTVVPVSQYRGGLERTGVMPGPAPSGRPGVLWRAETGAVIKGPIAVGNGLVYTGTDDGSVHAFDMTTGAEVWKLTGNTTIESPSIVLDGTTAYIAGYDGMVLAVDAATGAELWRTDPALNVSRRIAFDAAAKTIYVGGLEAVSYAFDSTSGALKWQVEIGGSQVSVASIVTSDTLYFGALDGLIYALNTADGSTRWTWDSTFDNVGSLAFGNNTIYGPTGIAGNNVFVAIDTGTGGERWRLTSATAPYTAASILGGNLFVGTELGEVMSVAQADGQVNWTFATGNGAPIWTAPSIVGDDLYVVDTEGSLYVVDTATGQEIWRIKLDGGINYSPAITGGVIYIGTWDGYVYALGDGGTEVPAATPIAGTPIPTDTSPEATPAAVTSNAVELLWETNGGPTPLQKSSNATIAPDGNIWVADGGHSQFQIFSPDGTFIEEWGTPGSGDGQFDFLRANSDGDSFGAVAFAPDGSFYVADMGNRRIQHFSADRTFLNAWGSLGRENGQLISPIDIEVDSQGNVFVDDDKRNDVQKFAADGTFLLKFGGFGRGPGQLDFQGWMTIDGEGNIWVADGSNGRIQEWANDGTFLREVSLDGTLGEPGAVAVDEQGRLYVLDNRDMRVVVLDSTYAMIASWDLATSSGAPLTTMNGVALDGEGSMYVTDYLESSLLKYQLGAIQDGAPADEVEVLWDIPLSGATLLTFAPDGTFWVADPGNSGFQILDTDGNFLERWTGTGDGQFGMVEDDGDPFGAVAFAADGSFYVLDPGARQVLAFAADRTFLSRFGEPGRGPGQFVAPVAIAVDPAGNVAVSDYGRADIQTFAPDGTLVATADLQSTYPVGNSMAIDGDGNFYVLEFQFGGPALLEKFDPAGNLLLQFGQGPGPGALLGQPLGIGLDAAGNVYVTEIEPAQVVVYSPEGEYLTSFGTVEDPTIQLPFPFDVAVDAQGDVYVSDPSQNKLVKLRLPDSLFPATQAVSPEVSPDAATTDSVEQLWENTGGDGGLDTPSSIAIAPDGTIWVADAGTQRFQIFGADGNFLESWTGTGNGQFDLTESDGDPVGAVAFTADGSFYVLDPGNRRLLVFAADRTFLRSIGGPGREPGQFLEPISIATDAAGNVAVLDSARRDIQTFAADGTLVATVLPQVTHTDPGTMGWMIVDSDGNYLISEASPDLLWVPIVEKFDPEGNLLQQFGDESGPGSFGRARSSNYHDQPVGIAVDAAGNVYIAEIGTNPRIVVFSPEGAYLTEFGNAGSATVAFDFPVDVALDDQGNLYVTDLVQNRLIKLRLPDSLAPATPTP